MPWTPIYDWMKLKLTGKLPKHVEIAPALPEVPDPFSARCLECLKMLAEFEGGKDDDPRDNGGRTAYGVTQAEYNKWRRVHNLPVQDVWNISKEEVRMIFKSGYWDQAMCDRLPIGTDYAVFDFWVNSGEGRLAREAQIICGITVDGDYGPKTFEAVRNMDPTIFVPKLYQRRMAFLRRLDDWDHFGKGWTNRCRIGEKFCMDSISGTVQK